MRIAVKLFIGFLVVVVIPLGLLAVTSTNLIDERMQALAQEAVDEKLRAAWIQFYVRGDQMKFGMLQAAAAIQHQEAIAVGDRVYLRNLFRTFKEERPYVDIWAVTDERGVVIAKLNDKFIENASLRGMVQSVLLTREPAVKVELLSSEVIAAYGDEALVSRLDNLGLSEGMALVAVVPVFKGDSLVGTIVTADLLVEDFFVVDELADRFPDAVFLIAQGDRVISTNALDGDKRVLGIRLPPHLMEDVKAGKAHRMVEAVGDKSYISASNPIKDGLDNVVGALFVGVPEGTYIALGRENINKISLAFLLALLAAMGIASIAVREISRPVEALVEATRRIKGGEFTASIEDQRLESKDELGELARSFSEMGQELKGLYEGLDQKVRERTEELEISNEELQVTNEELQVTNEELRVATEELQSGEKELKEALGRGKVLKAELEEYSKDLEDKVRERTRELESKLMEFSGLHKISDLFKMEMEPERIYGEVTGKIAEVMDVEQCCVVFYDSESMEFAVQYPAYGMGKEQLEALNFSLEEAAHTLEHWSGTEPLVSNEPAKDERLMGGLTGKFKERNLLLAKLLVAGEFLGVLRLANKRSGDFTSEDARLAEIVASRLGAAQHELKLFSELRESEEKYRLAIDKAGDAIFLVDAGSAMITEANGKAVALTGYSREELLKMKGWEVHPKEHHETCLSFIKKVVAGESITVEMELLNKDGTRVPVEISSVLISHGSRKFIQRIVRDITERKEYEGELKRRITELERMHRITVGRELRMKELKKKIEELEKR